MRKRAVFVTRASVANTPAYTPAVVVVEPPAARTPKELAERDKRFDYEYRKATGGWPAVLYHGWLLLCQSVLFLFVAVAALRMLARFV